MGRIINVKHSQDGLVRSVTILLPPLAGSHLQRSVSRAVTDLVLLIPSEQHSCLKPARDRQDGRGVSSRLT